MGVNEISCRSCRQRKVRCDRVEPACTPCLSRKFRCQYDSRKQRPRKSKQYINRRRLSHDNGTPPYQREAAPPSPVRDPVINALEQDPSTFIESPSSNYESTPSNVTHSSVHTPLLTGTASPSARSYIFSRVRDLKLISHNFIRSLEDSCVDEAQEHDLCGMLDSIDQKVTEATQTFSQSPNQDSVDFPNLAMPSPAIQRKWMKDFFSEFDVLLHATKVERSLLYYMTDNIGSPHLQFSRTLLIAYYCALFYGSSIDSDLHLAGQFAEPIYQKLCVLTRYWKQNIPATSLDIFACLLLSDIMIIFMDTKASWFYFNKCCQLASALGYLDIDADKTPFSRESHSIEQNAEEKRYVFWELIQRDCCFRLMLDRSSVMSISRPKVDFPTLSCDTFNIPNTEMKQLYFVVSMRIIFAALRIWSTQTPSPSDALSHSDDLLETAQMEIIGILNSWDVKAHFQKARTEACRWIFADLLFYGYIIVMHLEIRQQEKRHRALSQVSRETALAYCELVREAIVEGRGPRAWASRYLGLYTFAPAQIIYQSVIETEDPIAASSYLAVLKWLSSATTDWTCYYPGQKAVSLMGSVLLALCQQLLPLKKKGRPFQEL